MSARSRLLPLLLAVSGCTPGAIAWEDITRRPVPAALADSALTAALATVLPQAAPPALLGDSLAVVADAPCAGSLRWQRLPTGPAALVWWTSRPDGRAQLRARTPQADTGWRASLAVDTVVARDSVGCRRPAPALAVDRASGWVHVAYTLVAPEGPGLFYAHQMDPRAPFEPPRVIVYGDGQPAAAVASDSALVVVAFENPNDRPTVAIALSRTGGHLFEPPVRVSTSSVPARRPQLRVRGDTIAVGWIEGGDAGTPATIVVRRGLARP